MIADEATILNGSNLSSNIADPESAAATLNSAISFRSSQMANGDLKCFEKKDSFTARGFSSPVA
jgi:hypothetical protein